MEWFYKLARDFVWVVFTIWFDIEYQNKCQEECEEWNFKQTVCCLYVLSSLLEKG